MIVDTKNELVEIRKVLESIRNFEIANAQLSKQILLELQKLNREVKNGDNRQCGPGDSDFRKLN